MELISLSLFLIILLFGFVVIFGAPYLPTLKPQSQAALDMLGLKPGQTLLELGAGDGSVVVAAAERGLKVVAYELNPALVLVAKIRTWRHKNVKIIWGNYWNTSWPEAEGIYVFLLDKYMKKLDKKIIQTYPRKKIKLASHAFQIPGKNAIKTKNGVFLYHYN